MDDTRDFGTPKKDALKQITLTIDGQKVSVAEGTSVMRAASELGTQLHVRPLLKREWLFQPRLQN